MQEVKLQFEKKENYRVKEAFRTLRSNVEFSGQDIRVIAITSCTPNEGKTSCAMNLARAFAESGKRTILVDADMRKSIMVGRYKTGSVRLGLTHYLVGQEYLDEVLCQSDVKNLDIIFAGPVPPNPSELLGSELFAEMVKNLRDRYDYVVIDTPPLGSVIDAAVASKHCDGTILIIENNAVSYRFVQHVKEQLDVAEAKILGAVLNKVNMTGKGYYGHYGNYYGRYYGKYYGKYYGSYGEENAPARDARREKAAPRAGASRNTGAARVRPQRNVAVDIDLTEEEGTAARRENHFDEALRDDSTENMEYIRMGEKP